MIFKPEYPNGATPLDPDELSGLIPKFISIQSELNIVEQENILSGIKERIRKNLKISLVLFTLDRLYFGKLGSLPQLYR